MVKKFILNADDFGCQQAYNTAVKEGYLEGFIQSVSLVANGECFEDSVNILSECPNLSAGIHLNINQGKSLCTDIYELTDQNHIFNNSFVEILIKTYNPLKKDFLSDVEREFRRQIEKVLASGVKISHINSHSSVHAIPRIFNIVAKLAREYNIRYIRNPYEAFYIIPSFKKHFSGLYVKNIIWSLFLKILSILNSKSVRKNNIKINKYVIGNLYHDMMDSLTVICGIMQVKDTEGIVEAVIHPGRYEDGTINNNFSEFLITRNKKLKEKIEKLGFKITNYADEEN